MSITDPSILQRLQAARLPKRPKEPSAPAKRSDKLKEEFKGYKKQVKIYLSQPDNLLCKIKAEGCTKLATCVHHTAGRTGAQLKKEEDWMPACESCNSWCESNDSLAREKGFKKSRLKSSKISAMEKTETVESIMSSTCSKKEKILKLKALGKTNKEIGELVGSNPGHIWNVLNPKHRKKDVGE